MRINRPYTTWAGLRLLRDIQALPVDARLEPRVEELLRGVSADVREFVIRALHSEAAIKPRTPGGPPH